ncbi:protein max isoform X2 [Brachyistius frenatus]|uniref:protein max isoform X2 n=1 Tax=Brachyistius frenatus TaxID=100188 RepID=UPI0037E7B883
MLSSSGHDHRTQQEVLASSGSEAVDRSVDLIVCQRPSAKDFFFRWGPTNKTKRKKEKSFQHNMADKRAHHNALERKRRDHIKDSFHSLRDSVPALQGEKVGKPQPASRAQILDKATEYIQYMRRKNHTHQQDIDDLKRQNALLEQQEANLVRVAERQHLLRALEKVKGSAQLQASYSSSDSSLYTNPKGSAVSAFDGGSDSSSESEAEEPPNRKKLRVEAS